MLRLKSTIVIFVMVLHPAALLLSIATRSAFLRPCITSLKTSSKAPPPDVATKLFTRESSIDIPSFPSIHGKTLVSVQDCIEAHSQQQISNSKVKFIDASWYHRPDPVTNIMRNPIDEFRKGPRLPNAHHLDIDALATTHELFPKENPLNLPHMMPPPSLFSMAMDAYGIENDDHVVIYAKRGVVFTPRVWFLFVSMGHDIEKVHLMQGSLEDWIEDGGCVETHSLYGVDLDGNFGEDNGDFFRDGILDVTELYFRINKSVTKYQVDCNCTRAAHICEKEEVLEAVNGYIRNKECMEIETEEPRTIIIDTRGSGYKKKGHMPSAIHLPYRSLVNPSNPLQLLPKSELDAVFTAKGINYRDSNVKIILSCGSGVSVCHGFLALKLLGREIDEENTRVYDGSWKEWGRLEDNLPRILPHEMND